MFIPRRQDFDGRDASILCFLHAVELGGVERVAVRLCRAWAEAGADVSILLGRADGAAECDLGGASVFVAPSPGVSPARFETMWMIWSLWRLLRVERFDMLFCAGNTYAVVAVAMRLLLGRRCPPIVMKISNSLDRRDLPAVVRPLYRLWCRVQGLAIDHIVAPLPEMRGEVASAMRVPPERVAAVANPVSDRQGLDRLAAAGGCARFSQRAGRRFLAIGRLERQKNFALLLDAFAAGARPGDRLTIVGEGSRRSKLSARAVRLGIAHRVTFAGRRDEMSRFFAAADALLLSSDYEGMPAVVVEALAAGTPVIATDCCTGVRTLLADPRVGRLVPTGDATALAMAIRGFDPARFDPARGRAIAARHLVGPAADTLLTLFRGLVRQPAPTPRNPG